MTPEKARRLSRILRQERLRKLLPVMGTVTVVLGVGIYMITERAFHVDMTLETHLVDGEVQATSRLSLPLLMGRHIELKSASHQSGQVAYDVIRVLN